MGVRSRKRPVDPDSGGIADGGPGRDLPIQRHEVRHPPPRAWPPPGTACAFGHVPPRAVDRRGAELPAPGNPRRRIGGTAGERAPVGWGLRLSRTTTIRAAVGNYWSLRSRSASAKPIAGRRGVTLICRQPRGGEDGHERRAASMMNGVIAAQGMTGTGGDRGAGIRLEFLARIGEPDQRHQRVGGTGVEEQARIEAGGNARGGGGRDHNPGDPPGREPGFLSVRRTVSWERVAAISPATARPASRRRDPTAEPGGGVPQAGATSRTAASALGLGGGRARRWAWAVAAPAAAGGAPASVQQVSRGPGAARGPSVYPPVGPVPQGTRHHPVNSPVTDYSG